MTTKHVTTPRRRVYEFRPMFNGKPAGAAEVFLTREDAHAAQQRSHVSGRVVASSEDARVVELMESNMSHREALRELQRRKEWSEETRKRFAKAGP